MNINPIAIAITRFSAGGDYFPALPLDFRTNEAIDSRITFSRASNATYFDSTGTLQTASSGVARANAFQDYNPSTLTPLGFLIEEQRTNLLLQSADFTTTWSPTNATITANSVVGPDGTQAADTLAITAAGGAIGQTTQTFTAGSTVTVSVFAKKNASNFVRFEIAGLVNCWFNLDTGATATNNAGSGNVLFSAKSIQALPNGWYRCVLTVTTTVVTSLNVLIFATNADNTSSSNGSSIYLWGAQAEVGAFVTSYIATTTAAATRLADVASITGSNFTGFWNATEGTIVASWDLAVPNSGSNQFVARASNNTYNNSVALNTISAGFSSLATASGGVFDGVASSIAALVANTISKSAGAYAVNNLGISKDGASVVTDTSATIPSSLTRLDIGSDHAGSNRILAGHIQSLAYYNKRLSDATLQQLTS